MYFIFKKLAQFLIAQLINIFGMVYEKTIKINFRRMVNNCCTLILMPNLNHKS